jgi:hypothetical protein
MENSPHRIEDLVLAISTVNRSPQYVHQTLASLFASDPAVHRLSDVWLLVDGNDFHLRDYRHHGRLRIVPLTPEERTRMTGWSIHRRTCHNYYRCLSVPLAGQRGIIVCEDDVVFRDQFLVRLIDTLEEMRAHRLHKFALALYASHDFEDEHSFYRGALYCSYGWVFFGSQCMYYPAETAHEIADYILRHGVETYEDPSDLLVKRVYGDRMYSCCRALAQHIGDVSTGLGGSARTPRFDRPYRPLLPTDWGQKS